MVHNCEALTGARWCIGNDPRITRIGWFLRVTHIDELPQLWNVLRGEMSLVGPRPERPEFVSKLEKALPRYEKRLAALPGLTGLAQIQLPPDSDLDSVRRKLRYDIYYVKHASLSLDLRILASTVLHVLKVPFVVSRLLLRLPGAEIVEGLPDKSGKTTVCFFDPPQSSGSGLPVSSPASI
jgi:lipopolysaccharide/colanic/teichoic acid biosynthesis glycosyltransferase